MMCAPASTAAHAHKTDQTKTARVVRRPVYPVPPQDPYAKYWDDPGRAAPPFSYRGSDTH